MPDVRYVCLSDMHLGASNSLLTYLTSDAARVDPTKRSPVLAELVECLREIISKNEKPERPTLVLNGDTLELALATDNLAGMSFERFAELILPTQDEPLFRSPIIYIPGNHDHHLWETAREAQYVNYISKGKPGLPLAVPWHATNMFRAEPPVPSPFLEELICLRAPSQAAPQFPSEFLEELIRRHDRSQAVSVHTIYPNWGLLDETGQRCVVFSHGHFTESMYVLMSTLRSMIFPSREMPLASWDYEAENFAWIDFFWSTMGRSGDVGTDLELVYDKLGSKKQVGVLISNLASSVVNKWGKRYWPRWLQRWAVKWALGNTLGKAAARERNETRKLLSADGWEGLEAYMKGPLREQILEEREHNMPPTVSFIYGHTHKPFQEDRQFHGYDGWTSVYNSGGWVVDTLKACPVHGGAVILVDEDHNVVSLRMYNEAAEPEEYAVKVEAANHPGGMANPLLERVRALVDAEHDPWKEFSRTVASERLLRVENLKMKIQSPG